MRRSDILNAGAAIFFFTGKSAGCPAFLLQGRGGKSTL